MNLSALDLYSGRQGPIHGLDARLKLVMALALILFINLTSPRAWPLYLLYLFTVITVVLVAKVPLSKVLARSMLALPFALLAALGMLYEREGAPVVRVPLFSWHVTFTDVGLLRFVGVMVKAWLSVLVSAALAFFAPFWEIVRAMQDLGVPRVLTATILLMYRYLAVLVDEAQRLMRAREARSAELVGVKTRDSLPWRVEVTGRMIGTLFLRTYERSERIYQAMLARGFSGEVRTLGSGRLSKRDIAFAGLILSALASLVIIGGRYG